MSFRILHIDEDFAAASFQSVYSEHGRLEHLVAVRLNTCNDTWCGETREQSTAAFLKATNREQRHEL